MPTPFQRFLRCLLLALLVLPAVTGAAPALRPPPRIPAAGPRVAVLRPPPAALVSRVANPAPPAPPPCADPRAWSEERRLAQLLMVSGQFADPAASAPVAAAGAGGFVFFGAPPAGSGPAVEAGLGSLDAAAAAAGQVRPWIATDEEGGYVQRLAAITGPLPSARAMAAGWSPGQVRDAMAAHGRLMLALGVDMDLAAVIDTASPGDPVADEADRSFSEDPAIAGAYGLAFADGLREAGVTPVLKHFPGFGHAAGDSDAGPATDPPLAALEGADLRPFEQAIAAGEPALMVSNAAVPGLSGGLPASLAPATYAYLRDGLHFQGVAITDSLTAGAVASAGYPAAAAAALAVEAGADMPMVDAGSWPAALAALEQAEASGALPRQQVTDADDRVLEAKGLAVCAAPVSAA